MFADIFLNFYRPIIWYIIWSKACELCQNLDTFGGSVYLEYNRVRASSNSQLHLHLQMACATNYESLHSISPHRQSYFENLLILSIAFTRERVHTKHVFKLCQTSEFQVSNFDMLPMRKWVFSFLTLFSWPFTGRVVKKSEKNQRKSHHWYGVPKKYRRLPQRSGWRFSSICW